MTILPFLLAQVAATTLPQPPVAAGGPNVSVQEIPYQAWVLRCETQKEPKPERTLCGLTSTISAQIEQDKQNILARIMVRPAQAGKGYQIAFELPLGVLLMPGALVADAAQKTIVRLPFIACRPNSCEAGAVLTAEQMDSFRKSGSKNTVFYQLQNGKAMKLDFSMAGFGAAIEKLESRSKP